MRKPLVQVFICEEKNEAQQYKWIYFMLIELYNGRICFRIQFLQFSSQFSDDCIGFLCSLQYISYTYCYLKHKWCLEFFSACSKSDVKENISFLLISSNTSQIKINYLVTINIILTITVYCLEKSRMRVSALLLCMSVLWQLITTSWFQNHNNHVQKLPIAISP